MAHRVSDIVSPTFLHNIYGMWILTQMQKTLSLGECSQTSLQAAFGGRDLHGSLFLLRSGLVEWTLRGVLHYQTSSH